MVALEGTQDTSNTTPHALDQNQLKRQQERERYARMSVDKRMKRTRSGLCLMKKGLNLIRSTEKQFDEEKCISPVQ
jgi:hypothetical protein